MAISSFREFLSQLRRVKPHQETYAITDDGLVLVESVELDQLTHHQRLSLVERIERAEGALTADDLARLLNVSRISIFKHAAAGRIPSFRIGTSVRFDPKSVAEWLRKQ